MSIRAAAPIAGNIGAQVHKSWHLRPKLRLRGRDGLGRHRSIACMFGRVDVVRTAMGGHAGWRERHHKQHSQRNQGRCKGPDGHEGFLHQGRD